MPSPALRRILTDHSGARILIIGHGETIEAAHSLLLDLPSAAGNRPGFVTEHTGLVRWQHHVNRFQRGVWMLAAHNDTKHLTDLDREPHR